MKYRKFTFGERLKEYRERKGLTQETISDRSGLRSQHISAIESGLRKDPHLSTVIKILNALDVGFDEIILQTK